MDAWYSCHENIQEKHSTQTGGSRSLPRRREPGFEGHTVLSEAVKSWDVAPGRETGTAKVQRLEKATYLGH